MKLKDKAKYLTNNGEVITVYELQDMPDEARSVFVGTNGIRYSENGETKALFVAHRYIEKEIEPNIFNSEKNNNEMNFSLTLEEAAAITILRVQDSPKPPTAEEMTLSLRRALKKIHRTRMQTLYPIGTVLRLKMTEETVVVVDHDFFKDKYCPSVYNTKTTEVMCIDNFDLYEVISRPGKR